MQDTVSRLGALAIVVLLHVAVLSVRWRLNMPKSTEPRSSTWIDIEPQADAPSPEMGAIPRELGLAVSPPRAPAFESDSLVVPAPPINWSASMNAAAGSAVVQLARQEAYRPLGQLERDEAGSSPSESIFERPPREAGDIDYDPVQGRTVVWHNEHCYTELSFPTIKDPIKPKSEPNPPKCIFRFGKQSARGDLFDDIKKR